MRCRWATARLMYPSAVPIHTPGILQRAIQHHPRPPDEPSSHRRPRHPDRGRVPGHEHGGPGRRGPACRRLRARDRGRRLRAPKRCRCLPGDPGHWFALGHPRPLRGPDRRRRGARALPPGRSRRRHRAAVRPTGARGARRGAPDPLPAFARPLATRARRGRNARPPEHPRLLQPEGRRGDHDDRGERRHPACRPGAGSRAADGPRSPVRPGCHPPQPQAAADRRGAGARRAVAPRRGDAARLRHRAREPARGPRRARDPRSRAPDHAGAGDPGRLDGTNHATTRS